ncbi:hypothetical protein AUP68_08662 [Ilyonectria robusta]
MRLCFGVVVRAFDVLAAGLNLVRQRVATSTTTLLRSNARVAVMMPGQAATSVLTLPYRLCIIVLLALVSPAPFAAAAEGRYSNCSSFATNGSAASQFAYYRFYDFRNISADTWDSVEEPKSPNNITAGACTAFFTYENDTQEADIELLTRNKPDVVGFNTQPTLDIHGKFVPDSHWNMSFPNNVTRDSWVNYRMDWVGDQVVWYVNGVHMANTSVNVPVEPSRLSIAMWGNGGTWTGNMTLGKSALLEVQWIEVVYNLSGTSPAENGHVGASVCNLDGEDDESGWQPYIFPPAHNSSSGGYKVGLWILLLHLAILSIMYYRYQ